VLDVGDDHGDENVLLVQGENSIEPYAALSYRWGPDRDLISRTRVSDDYEQVSRYPDFPARFVTQSS